MNSIEYFDRYYPNSTIIREYISDTICRYLLNLDSDLNLDTGFLKRIQMLQYQFRIHSVTPTLMVDIVLFDEIRA